MGQRTWNPFEKVSKTFDCSPCRIEPHVLAKDNAAASATKKVIVLKGGDAPMLQTRPRTGTTGGGALLS